MTDRVVVRAPATIANLGPGFDCLGMALAWYDEVSVERDAAGIAVTVAGHGAEKIPREPDGNLVARGIGAVLGTVPSVRIHQRNGIPFGRGFGSSAAAIVAGIVAGRALEQTDHSDAELLRLATALEGHGDNVAPCLLGGITVVAGERAARIDPPEAIVPLVCVAAERLPTRTARAVLPDVVSRADAVANLGRAALLAAMLATGRTDALLEATDDLLHQPARFRLSPDSGTLVKRLRDEGIAAFLSGAGPSVAALVAEAEAKKALEFARSVAPDGWEVRLEAFAAQGAHIVENR